NIHIYPLSLHDALPISETQRASGAEAPPKKHFDAVQVQREARELSDLARSIPLDVEHVNKGLMPKDIVEKLKRIEKLSKHLRTRSEEHTSELQSLAYLV